MSDVCDVSDVSGDDLKWPPAFAPLGPRLRAYTPALASLARLLFGRPATAEASVPFEDYVLRDISAQTIWLQRPATLGLDTAYGPLTVQFDSSQHVVLAAIALETSITQRLALATLWLADTLHLMSCEGLGTLTLTHLHCSSTAQAAHGLVLEYNLPWDPQRTRSVIAVTAAPVALVAQLEQQRPISLAAIPPDEPRDPSEPRNSLAALSGSLQLPTRLRLRSRHCPAAHLATLRPGDILLGWPRARGYRDGAVLHGVTLHWGAASGHVLSALATVSGRTILLETFPQTMRDDPTEHLNEPLNEPLSALLHEPLNAPPSAPVNPPLNDLSASATASATLDLAALELPLHLEVLCASLPLAQLSALAPGYVLPLPVTLAEAQVRLVAYGQTLAFGELVAVGDQLGLHIQRLTQNHERHT
ncbi:type III secretion system cytoplasmic ring protein SctQ [Paraburkholderia bonniea]|uniref:type III secretion system cytoplasmic ring protein SctQ n=1 Tax=Paraburkholderia bonniea TaxID=2152891 RepID=UPI002573F286|nr:type III secretion system cytoplasmic ring protein SctQ [Paraburkholderia bonniea]WJF89349.1 type III secretion system cytoplasmic ring protein SctQ [Paraburkholderia bonniea]WJF92664.1 type III secretion system cytoplasmic ring protein SctQ [Paraburkholderia bonniea]